MGHRHVWLPVAAVFAGDAQLHSTCDGCGADTVETTVTLNPGIDADDLEDDDLRP